MIQTFAVQNVKCEGCAHTLKSKLEPLFGEISVNLEVFPREITLDIGEEQKVVLSQKLRSLGYPMVGEEGGFVDATSAKAKSFFSCAVGKMNR